jgi:hypothetical protein
MNPVWYVPNSQEDMYKRAGAENVVGVIGEMPMKSIQLNHALNYGFDLGQTVVTLDDDFHNVKKTFQENNKLLSVPYSLKQTIIELSESLQGSLYHLAGAGPSLNAFFSGTGIKNRGKVNGQLSVQTPNIVRYDELLKSQVDFEYCLAHHAEHGGVVIHKSLLIDFHLYGRNASKDSKYTGGLAGLRTDETNEQAARVMTQRYGVTVEPEGVGKSRKSKVSYKRVRWAGNPSWIM